MARKPRVHVPSGTYHVILRSNGGRDIFFERDHRGELYRLLAEGTRPFGYRAHAYCLISNPLHLALEVGRILLSRGMQNLAFRYTRWIDRREKRKGHLFQGGYKALLVDRHAYLLELVRYIHLNPVRAGLVSDPLDYPWSGHRAYLGREEVPWLSTDWVLSQFDERLGIARCRYRAFVRASTDEGYREEFHAGAEDPRVLGDEGFLASVLKEKREKSRPIRRPSLTDIIQAVCAEYGLAHDGLRTPTQSRLASEARAAVGWLASELGSASLVEVGRETAREVSTISSAVRRLSERAREGTGQDLYNLAGKDRGPQCGPEGSGTAGSARAACPTLQCLSVKLDMQILTGPREKTPG
jgi:putative transposase